MLKPITAASVIALCAGAAQAEMNFARIASFATPTNMAEGEDTTRETSAEIIAASEDGMTLIYTDSPLGAVGLIDITDPAAPAPLGNTDMQGEPTSVAVLGGRAFIGVNTSESYTDPSGHLSVLDMTTRDVVSTCDLGGQPDSIAMAKDGTFISVAIENERDEDAGDGRTGQMPAGFLVQIDVIGADLACDSLRRVDLTWLADVSPEDPEPEFVDTNAAGETVVTMQENNHLVIVSRAGEVIADFSAGAVDLDGIDATDERGALLFTESQPGRLREPDAVKWIDDTHFATANEGDMDGGTRGWTIFAKDGTEVYESGASFEHALVQIGHYPDKRSDAKGVEPESIETATFDGTPLVFVGSERGSAVGVYDVTDPTAPELRQILPSGIGPEGYVALPDRNLLVSANETDLIEDGGVRAHVMIYQYREGAPTYPQLTSEGAETLIGWGAISGMVADREAEGTIYAVNDSFYGYQPTIFTIDATATPARITAATPVTRAGMPAQKLDLEGITTDGEGGFWLASEGRSDRLVPHALVHVNGAGEIVEEIGIPAELIAVEQRYGFEGVTWVGDTLWMAVQREWDDDAQGMVKLVAYTPATGEWGAVHYPLDRAEAGWVGLSEIVAQGDTVYIIERDNQIGDAARIKKIYTVPAADLVPAPLGGDLPVVTKTEAYDLIPDLKAQGGYVVDKVEGLAITPAGAMFVSTDNDGVDDSSGETFFWQVELPTIGG